MSLLVAGSIAGASLLAGLLVAISGQIRAELRRRCEPECDERFSAITTSAASRTNEDGAVAAPRQRDIAQRTAKSLSDDARAAACQEILDALGNELDQDIAEWEAVLEGFAQTIGSTELRKADALQIKPVVRRADEASAVSSLAETDPKTLPHRTRPLSGEETGMIQRLLRSDFAPEEIALWLNLPLERVQEVLLRDELT